MKELPFDLTASMSSNTISGELVTLTKVNTKKNRIFIPEFGAYYTDTLVVRTSSGAILTRDKDYVTTYYYPDIGILAAKEACAMVVVTNAAIGNDLRVSYQAVGGVYALSVKELAATLAELENGDHTVKWEDIIDKPTQYTPAEHTHEFWQIYGMESNVEVLEDVAKSISVGRAPIMDNNREYYNYYVNLIANIGTDYKNKVLQHINDTNNPHKTDKVKIGLSNINNWGLANKVQSETVTNKTIYQPISGVYNQLAKEAIPKIIGHIADTNNPHQLKLTDPLLNLYSSSEIEGIFDAKLAKTAIAANTASFAGTPSSTLYTNIRTNLDGSNVDKKTKFTIAALAPALNWQGIATDYVLLGNSVYRRFNDVFKDHNDNITPVVFAGSVGYDQTREHAIEAITNNTWTTAGTYVIGAYNHEFYPGAKCIQLIIYLRTATGWQALT